MLRYAEMRDLAQSVYSGIRTPRSDDYYLLAQEDRERILNHRLNRCRIDLGLPSPIKRAIVGNRHFINIALRIHR